ncbi:hypothetical protein B0H16DRAFT_1560691 [Mycena metata]|uniref:Survival Motor Neuron Gemin2-binding domain-containing protein n=1 Tax=Mycena metata TaxID=1033252 RepID=A0AAD7N2R4_9AGAR|nr:hypothetical protein B0H16DRAFT_1560691 [Mycena metata]
MQRTVISYDDITLPYSPEPPQAGPAHSPSTSGQSKKRKWSNQKSGGNKNNNKAPNGPATKEAVAVDEDEDADSRYLTAEEIWDDSALIDAWDAATEEYEALNGPDKGWKKEPVHKSPLWYNVPPTKPPNKKLKTETTADADAPAGEDSQPLDFDTFVPSYDASLALLALPALPAPIAPGAAPESGYDYSSAFPPPAAGMASQDEAFARALGAMYWGGYWTAVYHCHRGARQQAAGEEDEAEDGGGAEGDDDQGEYGDEEEAFVPTQR